MAIKVLLKNGTQLEFDQGQLVSPSNSQQAIIVITQGRTVGFEVVALINTAEVLAAYDSNAGRVSPPKPADPA